MDLINLVTSTIGLTIEFFLKYYAAAAALWALPWALLTFMQMFPLIFGGYFGIKLWDAGHDNVGVVVLCAAVFYEIRWAQRLQEQHPNMRSEWPLLVTLDKAAIAMARLPLTGLEKLGLLNLNFDHGDASSWSAADEAAEAAWRAHQQRQQQEEAYQRSQQQGGAGGGARHEETTRGAGDYAEALRLFDLAEPFTKEELATAYRAKVNAMHPDRWEGLPPHIKQQLDDQLKTLNAARDLIKQRRGWK